MSNTSSKFIQINNNTIKKYVEYHNFHNEEEKKESVDSINNQILSVENDNLKKKSEINYEIICQLAEANNGVVTNKMLVPFKISRQYICDLIKKGELERIDRGIYCLNNSIEDTYYTFQYKYMKTIFSHMNALYFYGLTEEFPSTFTVTVPYSYHVGDLKEKADIFYAKDNHMIIGLTTLKTPMGNFVRSYDMERSICDIIKSKNRMDFEQVKKSVRMYMKREDKDLLKLSAYALRLGIHDKVMSFVEVFDE